MTRVISGFPPDTYDTPSTVQRQENSSMRSRFTSGLARFFEEILTYIRMASPTTSLASRCRLPWEAAWLFLLTGPRNLILGIVRLKRYNVPPHVSKHAICGREFCCSSYVPFRSEGGFMAKVEGIGSRREEMRSILCCVVIKIATSR